MAVLVGALSREQKLGFALMFIFAVLSVGLGVLQLRNTLYGPLALNSQPPVNLKDQVNTIDALRYRDTDHDGLNDFDELYVYGTSPYLYDTFGYGLSDKEVIAKGLPLCPKGQDCASPITTGGAVATANASTTAIALQGNLGAAPPNLMDVLQDTKQVRALLLGAGMDPAVLQKISDNQLQQVVAQIMANTTTVATLERLQKAVSASSTAQFQNSPQSP